MATPQSSVLAKNAANLAAQLALVESRGREKTESQPSTGTVVSAGSDSIKDSMPTSRATSHATTGHTSPTKLDDSRPTSWVPSLATTGHTSPTILNESIATSWATSQTITGHTSPAELEDIEEAQAKTLSQEPKDPHLIIEGDGNTDNLVSPGVEEENLAGGISNKVEVNCYSVAEAVEAFEAKITRTKKPKQIPHPVRSTTFGWKGLLILGLTLVGVCALIFSYHYISECIIIIKVKH